VAGDSLSLLREIIALPFLGQPRDEESLQTMLLWQGTEIAGRHEIPVRSPRFSGFPLSQDLTSSSLQRFVEDMECIYAVFAGSVIREGSGKNLVIFEYPFSQIY
jgi:hypothetical protein